MKKKITKSPIIIILTVLFISGNSFAFSAVKVLTTDHFKINYDMDNRGFAVAVAVKSESYNDKISAFLETEPPVKVNIFLSGYSNSRFFRKTSDKVSNDLFFSTSGNFNIIESELYTDIFLIYLNNILQDSNGYKIIGENFINAIIQYPGLDHVFIETRINDLVNVSLISSIDLTEIGYYNRDEQVIIYTGLIDFVIKAYGKKKFIQSLKDAGYYGNFYLSLANITGDSIKAISDNFNAFLYKRKAVLPLEPGSKKQFLNDIDEFSDISYSIFKNTTVAVLQKNNCRFRLLLKIGENTKIIQLDHSESESFFSGTVFINEDQIAIVEILESGSTIHIFDIRNNKFLDKKFLPSLFISSINHADDIKKSQESHYNLIFSARCGLTSDIYTFNIKNGDFNIITETGNNYYPVSSGDKVYFVSNTDKYCIIESDSVSCAMKTIFTAEMEISYLSITDENKLIFLTKINGLENIYTIDLSSGNLQQITTDSHSKLAPQVSGKNIFFLSFYKGRYRLFFDIYNRPDF